MTNLFNKGKKAIQFHISESQHQKLTSLATEKGLSLSTWCRVLILNELSKFKIDEESNGV